VEIVIVVRDFLQDYTNANRAEKDFVHCALTMKQEYVNFANKNKNKMNFIILASFKSFYS
jgi:hypothetical protein